MKFEDVETALSRLKSKELREDLFKRVLLGESFSVESKELAKRLKLSHEDVDEDLSRLAEVGLLSIVSWQVCRQCGRYSGRDVQSCEECDTLFLDTVPELVKKFTFSGTRTRDPRWMFTVHGMNTVGSWQQDFSWNVARAYNYAIPIFIYKYGRIRVSPLLSFRQEKYVRALRNDLNAKISELQLDRGPDVLAHSFGTWLIAEALRIDPTLRVGRVILTGSIVAPDYDWETLFQRGQVEAVLCHTAGRDLWVRVAPFTIPSSGPSGTYGFHDRTNVVHVHSSNYSHSDFFRTANLKSNLERVWKTFLAGSRPETTSQPIYNWRRKPWHGFGQALKILILAALAVTVAFALVAFLIGIRALVLRRW